MIHIKGYAKLGNGKHGWIEVEKPVAGPLDAIVRPIAVSPCSSDVHAMHTMTEDMPVYILGHEAVAEVVEVGSLVTKFKPGDKVVVPCCTPNWLEPALQQHGANNAHDVGMMGSFKYMSQTHGVFAEYFKVICAEANMVQLPETVSVEAALMAVDMMSTGFYGVEQADVQFGDTVVVFGIGPVGLMAVAGARLRGAGRIIAIGTRPNCVALAQEYGATDIVSYKDGDIVQQIYALNGGAVDRVIIAGGDAGCLSQALMLAKPNSVISNVNFFDAAEVFQIPTYLWGLGMSDVAIKGGCCPGGALRMQKLLNVIAAGRVDPGKLLNYKFDGFDKIPDAFILMDEKPKDLIKPIVYI